MRTLNPLHSGNIPEDRILNVNTGNLRSSQDAFENIQQIKLIKSENSFNLWAPEFDI
jgi:hypothetical protein